MLSSNTLNLSVEEAFKDYSFCHSFNLTSDVTCFICRLELPCGINSKLPLKEDLYLSAQIFSNQIPLHSCRINSRFGHIFEDTTNVICWDEVLTFPIKYRDLALDSVLVITILDDTTVYGGTTIPFYDENCVLKTGKQKLVFYFNKPGDPNTIPHINTTPGQLYDSFKDIDILFQMEKKLEKYYHHHKENTPSSTSTTAWLDKLTIDRIEHSLRPHNNSIDNGFDWLWGCSDDEMYFNQLSYLIIEFPIHMFPVLFEEKVYTSVVPHVPLLAIEDIASGCVRSGIDISNNFSEDSRNTDHSGVLEFSLMSDRHQFNPNSICVVADWDLYEENLAEAQYRCLAHESLRGTTDQNIKPNLQEKETIDR